MEIDDPEFWTASSAGNSGTNIPPVEGSNLIPCSTGTPDTCSCHLMVLEFYSIISSVRFFYFSVCSLLVVFTDD